MDFIMVDTRADTSAQDTGNDESGTIAAMNAFEAMLTGEPPDTQPAKKAPPKAKAEAVKSVDAQQESEAETPDDPEESEETAADETDPDDDDKSTEVDDNTIRATVKIDGKETDVPLPELVKGYQRQQDYSRKTQALAEERKTFEAEANQVLGERQQYGELIGQLQQRLEALAPQQPDWNRLMQENPQQYLLARQQWADYQGQLQATQAEQARLQTLSQREQEQTLQAHANAERSKLIEAKPEWQDPQKWEAAKSSMMTWGQANGFTADELKGVADSRVVLALYKAAQYDKLMSQKPKADPPRTTGTMRPGTASPPASKRDSELSRLTQRLKESGSSRDAEMIFDRLLNS